MVDKVRCQQIVINLLQNAIKFSPSFNKVTLSIEEFKVDGRPNHEGVKISVQDNGIGISKNDKKNLFKMYFKTQDQTSSLMNKGSHGIGLSVCKRLA
jgi:signal transduction histidine kinase